MVQLTFYGGINEIGGNKILPEDSLIIYHDTIASSYPTLWLRNTCQEYHSSESPGFYIDHLSQSGINVILPTLGGTIEV